MNIDSTLLWTAVITPMTLEGAVDFKSLKKILDAQNEAGNGILILGSTGEALNIDESEAKEILEYTAKQQRSVPLMCGIGGINLSQTLKWLNYINSLDIDCYLSVTPLYAKPGDEGQRNWFKSILDNSARPVMLYNVPSRTGISLSLSAVKTLNKHKNFWAIKEASGSVEEFQKYIEASDGKKVYSGDDAMMPVFSKYSCSGLVSVAANVRPKETNLYVKKCLANELTDSKLWEECSNSLFVASNPIPVKWLMSEIKQIDSSTLRPPLTDRDMCKKENVLNSHENIKNWYNSNK